MEEQVIKNKKIVLLTAPSGAGKSTIAQYLVKNDPQLTFSISAATRPARGGEKNGVDYYFISEKEFTEKIKSDAFVEWEMVYEGNYYGTLKSELERIWALEKIPILDIDVKGAIHVKRLFGKDCYTIFIMPPSVDELRKRLLNRNTDSSENIEIRLNKASYEISFKDSFDKIIINTEKATACKETEACIRSFLNE